MTASLLVLTCPTCKASSKEKCLDGGIKINNIHSERYYLTLWRFPSISPEMRQLKEHNRKMSYRSKRNKHK